MPGAPDPAGDAGWPVDAVELGRVAAAWGVRGDIKVQPWSDDPRALLNARRWWLVDAHGHRLTLQVNGARLHGAAVVAGARELPDRNAAEALRGATVFVARADFPAAAPDEFYWHDLVGMVVRNREGVVLGEVAGLLDTGAHSVLRVLEAATQAERLIPFVAAYVDHVDAAARRIDVDWDPAY